MNEGLNTIKVYAVKAKNHVMRHKGAYAGAAVAVAAIALQQGNRRAFYAFLEEKGIDPVEFYYPEWYEDNKSS